MCGNAVLRTGCWQAVLADGTPSAQNAEAVGQRKMVWEDRVRCKRKDCANARKVRKEESQ